MKTVLTVTLGILLVAGCATTRLPPALSAADMARIQRSGMTVGVEEYRYPVYTDSLIADLRKTGLFGSVDRRWDLPVRPDVVATVEEPIHGTASLRPLLTLVTLGIIPTTIVERHGQVFSLVSPDRPTESVRISYTYESESVLGWVALFLNLSPNWSLNPSANRRYLDGLALAISTNSPALDALRNSERKPEPPHAGDVSTRAR